MILGVDIIRKYIKNGVKVYDKEGKEHIKPLIEGLGPDQIDGIEGVQVDLRLDKAFSIKEGAQLCVNSRTTPKVEECTFWGSDNRLIILPNEYMLVQTKEWVNIPLDLVADVRGRTSLFRSGLILKSAYVSSNYQGVLTFGLHNASGAIVKIEKGFRISSISFHKIDGKAAPYHGIWGGDKVSTNGEVERPW